MFTTFVFITDPVDGVPSDEVVIDVDKGKFKQIKATVLLQIVQILFIIGLSYIHF